MKRLLPFLLAPLVCLHAQEKLPPFDMSIERLDPAFDALVAADAKVEKLAEGFNWSEGPTWFGDSVVFSDVPENIIYQWKPGATAATVFLKPSGLLQPTPGFREQGSNGLGLDAEGRLLICQHGERRIARLEKDGTQTSLADRFEGKRFNSPNDLTLLKDGTIYFTDPPYGLDGLDKSPLKELPFNGVFRRATDGKVTAVIKDLTFPNGIAVSPDEKILYVAVSDGKAPRIMAYDLKPDGSVENARVFFDAGPLRDKGRKGSCDGLKVDATGNVWATGPGGVLVIAPAVETKHEIKFGNPTGTSITVSEQGKHLGTILTNQATGNCCWGDDGKTLYVTADMFLVRVKTKTKGAGWQ